MTLAREIAGQDNQGNAVTKVFRHTRQQLRSMRKPTFKRIEVWHLYELPNDKGTRISQLTGKQRRVNSYSAASKSARNTPQGRHPDYALYALMGEGIGKEIAIKMLQAQREAADAQPVVKGLSEAQQRAYDALYESRGGFIQLNKRTGNSLVKKGIAVVDTEDESFFQYVYTA